MENKEQLKRLFAKYFNFIAIFCFVLMVFIMRLFFPFFEPNRVDSEKLVIPRGASAHHIAEKLEERNIIRSQRIFRFYSRILNYSTKYKAGTYDFGKRRSLYAVMTQIVRGDVYYKRITFPEGLRAVHIASILNKQLPLDSAQVMYWVNNEAFVSEFGIAANSLEGYLYPETYFFPQNFDEKAVLKTMVKQLNSLIPENWRNRADSLGFSWHQVITLASIIEGEAIIAEERQIVSSVYHNRLRKRMHLQACPTIQYLLPDGPRRLLTKDLEIDSPYNTYRNYGLPPGPVSNPGLQSIRAALYPADTDFLYMVAKGDGSHVFSRSLSGHLRAKNDFDIYRNELLSR